MGKKQDKTGQNDRPFRWNAAKARAALSTAEDTLTDHQIASEAGVSRSALAMWRLHPAFKARVDSHIAEISERIRRHGIAVADRRIQALQRRWELMNRVIDERASSDDMQDVPGGKTGLMVHNVKSIGAGPLAERVDLYEVDTGLLRELREHEKQAAQELGQWTEKRDLTSAGKPVKGYVDIDDGDDD
jgi:hypothetical protein